MAQLEDSKNLSCQEKFLLSLSGTKQNISYINDISTIHPAEKCPHRVSDIPI